MNAGNSTPVSDATNFSCRLVLQYKAMNNFATDSDMADSIPQMNKGNLSKILNGAPGRFLNENQVVFIAEKCGLNPGASLAELSAEKSKCAVIRKIWLEMANKHRGGGE